MPASIVFSFFILSATSLDQNFHKSTQCVSTYKERIKRRIKITGRLNVVSLHSSRVNFTPEVCIHETLDQTLDHISCCIGEMAVLASKKCEGLQPSI